MATIAKTYVQVIPSAEGIKGSLSKVLSPEVSSAGGTAGKGLASAITGTLAKIGIGAAIGKTIKDSLDQGGKLQQSLGGVETLFKNNANIVVKNAQNAWKTAGISANEYMEQSTSFAASLLQSLNGDTEAAAKYADMAITDMADNANKMGTPLENLQNAYQGFAKQNYTMLDNLKLGYGGTKAEMQRLLEDAQKFSGVEYDINNLNDVYEAIHVIQGELDITGTTAKEASTTLSGSAASIGAAWKNFLGNMSIGTSEQVRQSTQELMESIKTFLVGNLLPMIGNIIMSVPDIITGIFPQTEQAMGMLKYVFESAFVGIKSTFSWLKEQFETDGTYINSIWTTMNEIVTELGNIISDVLEKGAWTVSWFKGQVETEGTPINTAVTAIGQAFSDIKEVIDFAIGEAVGFIKSFTQENEYGESTVTRVWGLIRQAIVTGAVIINSFIESAKKQLEEWGITTETVKTTITTAFGLIKLSIDNAITFITGMLAGIQLFINGDFSKAWTTIKETIGECISNIVGFFKNDDGLVAAWAYVTQMMNTLKGEFDRIFGNIRDALSPIIDTIKGFFGHDHGLMKIWDDVVAAVEEVKTNITDTWQEIYNFFDEKIQAIKGLLDFSWEIPMPKLPHITVSETSGPFGITLPSFSVEWYAKAMDVGYMFNSPTVLGNKGFGDAGAEMVIGRDRMMSMISDAQSEGMERVVYTLEKMIEIFADYFPDFAKGSMVSIDGDQLVDKTADRMYSKIKDLQRQEAW